MDKQQDQSATCNQNLAVHVYLSFPIQQWNCFLDLEFGQLTPLGYLIVSKRVTEGSIIH